VEDIGMDAETMLRIKPELTTFLHQFDDCFGRITTRRYLDLYVEGQLSDLPRKSLEPMADAVGEPPRNLQEFLSLFRWDEGVVRDRLQQYIARRHSHAGSVGVIDETSFVKKGDKTAGVQRQYCGAVGKTENCVVSVHLGYATADFHTLLDGEVYLPRETWDADRDRCRKAGIPEEVVYRPKWEMALGQYQRAVANGVRFGWLTFDEHYGGKPPFLRALDGFGQNYVAEVPSNFPVWTARPAVLYRDHARDKTFGRLQKYPRLKVKNNPRVEVRQVLRHSPRLRKIPWETYHVKDTTKGPMVWRAKRMRVYLADEHALPTRPYHLLLAQNALGLDETKYFLSNGPPDTAVTTLLRVAFSRSTIERAFEDSKMELGMDHFEVRRFLSIHRHLILTGVSHTFLIEFADTYRGKKSGPDPQPDRHRHGEAGPPLGPRRSLFPKVGGIDHRAISDNAGPKRQGRAKPPTRYDQTITCPRHPIEKHHQMPLASVVAL
jgi:SRSO17 transposase